MVSDPKLNPQKIQLYKWWQCREWLLRLIGLTIKKPFSIFSTLIFAIMRIAEFGYFNLRNDIYRIHFLSHVVLSFPSCGSVHFGYFDYFRRLFFNPKWLFSALNRFPLFISQMRIAEIGYFERFKLLFFLPTTSPPPHRS